MNFVIKNLDNSKGGVITEGYTSYINETGSWRKGLVPVWDSEKCIQCGLCWPVCPENAISIDKDSLKRMDFVFKYCKGCGICAKICPVGAIKMVEEENE